MSKEKMQNNQQQADFQIIYNMGQTVLFLNMFSTQHLVAIIQALLHQGSTNCMHGDERACNMHIKRFLHAQNYVHINQSKHY